MKKVLRNVLVVTAIFSLLMIGISCDSAEKQKVEYIANIQPILNRSEVLDLDIHSIISSEITFRAQKEQVVTAEEEARELRSSLVSVVSPDNWEEAHEALLTAASTRLRILTHFRDFIDHLMLVDADRLLNHINKSLEYMVRAVASGSQTYADLYEQENKKAWESAVENRKWIEYAIGDLDYCDKTIKEYLAALQITSTQLSINIASRIENIDLSLFKQRAAEAKKLNDAVIEILEDR